MLTQSLTKQPSFKKCNINNRNQLSCNEILQKHFFKVLIRMEWPFFPSNKTFNFGFVQLLLPFPMIAELLDIHTGAKSFRRFHFFSFLILLVTGTSVVTGSFHDINKMFVTILDREKWITKGGRLKEGAGGGLISKNHGQLNAWRARKMVDNLISLGHYFLSNANLTIFQAIRWTKNGNKTSWMP